jgi:DNA-directed RNA polymerase I subunit RPA1
MAEGGEDDSDNGGDDDATRDKARGNKQQAGYEAYEDEEEIRIAREVQEADDVPEPDTEEDETYGGSPPPTSPPVEKETYKAATSAAKDREARIKGNKASNDIVQFSFDDKHGAHCKFAMEYDSTTAKILMLNIVETALRNALVQSVPNISLCILDVEASEASTDNSVVLLSNGVNIPAIWDYQHVVHPNRITTNSVADMLKYYGVEAARNTIVRELQSVFGGHAINVDPRHLTLIADFMTRGGEYAPFNRMGYRGNPSPFMKMSFETTLGFLKDAVQEADVDHLTGPSARIVTGRLGTMGTGGFDVFLPLKQNLELEDDEGEEDIAMTEGLVNEALTRSVPANGFVKDEESGSEEEEDENEEEVQDADQDEDEDEDVVMED